MAGAAVPGTQNVELVGHLGGLIRSLAVQGSYAYVGSGSELAELDIANPAAPKRVGYLLLPSSLLAVAVAGNYVYVGVSGGMGVVDITNPAAR